MANSIPIPIRQPRVGIPVRAGKTRLSMRGMASRISYAPMTVCILPVQIAGEVALRGDQDFLHNEEWIAKHFLAYLASRLDG